MNFIEFIGFIITLLAMFFILIKRSWDESRRRKNPEEYQQQEEDREKALKEFLRSLNVEAEEEEPFMEPPAPPPDMPEPKLPAQEVERIQPDYYSRDEIAKISSDSEIIKTEVGTDEHDVYSQNIVNVDLFELSKDGIWGVIGKQESSRVQKILKELDRPGDIVIYHEILGKPKALQNQLLPHDLSE